MQNTSDSSFDLNPFFSSYITVYEKFISKVLFLRPEDFIQVEHNFFAKQMDIFIKNGHHTLDYMKESFDLLENMLSFATTEATSHSKPEKKQSIRAAKKKNGHAPQVLFPVERENSPLATNASMDVMHQYTEKMEEYAADAADNKAGGADSKRKPPI